MPDNRRNNNRKGSAPIDPNFAHVQPQAVELERVVLGALMVDSDAFSIVSEILKPETFYEPRHQKIYEAIRQMNMDERPVDVLCPEISHTLLIKRLTNWTLFISREKKPTGTL